MTYKFTTSLEFSSILRLSVHKADRYRLFDDLIRSRKHVWRNREADLLGGLEIDDKLTFCRRSNGRCVGLAPLRISSIVVDGPHLSGSSAFLETRRLVERIPIHPLVRLE